MGVRFNGSGEAGLHGARTEDCISCDNVTPALQSNFSSERGQVGQKGFLLFCDMNERTLILVYMETIPHHVSKEFLKNVSLNKHASHSVL